MVRVAAPWRTPVINWLNGDHPISLGLLAPRPGYEFALDLPPPDDAARAKSRAAAAGLEAKLRALEPELDPAAIAEYVRSRDIESQAYVEAHDPDLVFLAGTPLGFGDRPWMIHIEELLPLFGPFFWSGKSFERSAYGTPIWRILKRVFEDPQCRSIFTHLRHSADWIGTLFDSPVIAAKTRHIPFGHAFPPAIEARVAAAQPARATRTGCTFLFTNSWLQAGESFVIRGGVETLLAFGKLSAERPDCRLIVRSQMPKDTLGEGFANYVRSMSNVTLIDAKMPYVDFVDLFLEADVYMIPSCGLHTVSLIEGMATGAAVIASDAPGADEFLKDGETGVAVKGRLGKLSYYDERGYLRQTFEPLFRGIDQEFVDGLYRTMKLMAEDKDTRLRLGRAGYAHVRANHPMAPWLDGFGNLIDEVRDGLA
jgi:glycosyltransferase involved in cell wall biosynthesis